MNQSDEPARLGPPLPPDPALCGICGSIPVFDDLLDLNVCPACGAHQTAKGWQACPG